MTVHVAIVRSSPLRMIRSTCVWPFITPATVSMACNVWRSVKELPVGSRHRRIAGVPLRLSLSCRFVIAAGSNGIIGSSFDIETDCRFTTWRD